MEHPDQNGRPLKEQVAERMSSISTLETTLMRKRGESEIAQTTLLAFWAKKDQLWEPHHGSIVSSTLSTEKAAGVVQEKAEENPDMLRIGVTHVDPNQEDLVEKLNQVANELGVEIADEDEQAREKRISDIEALSRSVDRKILVVPTNLDGIRLRLNKPQSSWEDTFVEVQLQFTPQAVATYYRGVENG